MDWFAKCLGKIETGPVFAEVLRVAQEFVHLNRRRKADGDGVKVPIADRVLYLLDYHLSGPSFGPDLKFPALLLLRDHELDVGAANVDHQNLFFMPVVGRLPDRG